MSASNTSICRPRKERIPQRFLWGCKNRWSEEKFWAISEAFQKEGISGTGTSGLSSLTVVDGVNFGVKIEYRLRGRFQREFTYFLFAIRMPGVLIRMA